MPGGSLNHSRRSWQVVVKAALRERQSEPGGLDFGPRVQSPARKLVQARHAQKSLHAGDQAGAQVDLRGR